MAFEIVAGNSAHCSGNYLSSAVNVVTNILKIPDQTEADFFKLSLPRIHGEIDNSSAVLILAVFRSR